LTGDAEGSNVQRVRQLSGPVQRYAVGAVLVRLSDEGSRVALVFLAAAGGLGARVGGLLVAALLLPHVLAAPVVGTLVDRSRRAARAVALLAAGFAAALGLAGLLVGTGPVALVAVVLLAGGCCGPALTGGLSSVLPDLVSRERLPRTFGVDSLTFNVAGVAGPAVAALLAGAVSPRFATSALAVSAGVGALLVATLPARPSVVRTGPPPDPGWLAGARAIGRDRDLAAVTAATTLGQVGAGALPVIAALIALRSGQPSQAAVLLGAVAAGGLLGSLAWTAHPAGVGRAPLVVMTGLVAAGLSLALAGTTGLLPVRVLLFGLSGVAGGPLFGALLLTRQDRAPAEARSQVFTLGAGAKITAAALGAGLGGALSSWAVSAQLLVVGAVHVLAGGLGVAAIGVRRARSRQPGLAA
jgi:MFS family permease